MFMRKGPWLIDEDRTQMAHTSDKHSTYYPGHVLPITTFKCKIFVVNKYLFVSCHLFGSEVSINNIASLMFLWR